MKFPGRLALQQRVIPAYRAPFYDLLAGSCQGGLSIFAGQPLPVESIVTTSSFDAADFVPARNHHFRETLIIRKIDTCFGDKLKRVVPAGIPFCEGRQQRFLQNAFAADEIVVDDKDTSPPSRAVERFQFAQELVRILQSGSSAIQGCYTAELAIVRTSP